MRKIVAIYIVTITFLASMFFYFNNGKCKWRLFRREAFTLGLQGN